MPRHRSPALVQKFERVRQGSNGTKSAKELCAQLGVSYWAYNHWVIKKRKLERESSPGKKVHHCLMCGKPIPATEWYCVQHKEKRSRILQDFRMDGNYVYGPLIEEEEGI